jgi:hypothetical protein
MTRIRKKYSIFCTKRPKQQGIVTAVAYVREHDVWAVCKGKLYVDGRFRYVYNGREGIVHSYQVYYVPDADTKRLNTFARELNLKHLDKTYPKKYKSRQPWWVLDDYIIHGYGELLYDPPAANPPVVAQEPDIQPAQANG